MIIVYCSGLSSKLSRSFTIWLTPLPWTLPSSPLPSALPSGCLPSPWPHVTEGLRLGPEGRWAGDRPSSWGDAGVTAATLLWCRTGLGGAVAAINACKYGLRWIKSSLKRWDLGSRWDHFLAANVTMTNKSNKQKNMFLKLPALQKNYNIHLNLIFFCFVKVWRLNNFNA